MIKDLMKKFITESKHFLKIGIPIFGSQLSYMIMHTTDTIVSGQYELKRIGWSCFSKCLYLSYLHAFSGNNVCNYSNSCPIIWFQRIPKIGQKMRQIFLGSYNECFFGFLYFYFFSKVLPYFPLDEEILIISSNYLQAVSVGMFFYIMFRFLSSYSEGMTLTLPVFYVVLFGALINIPLDIIFAFGYFGVPEMGSVGCGYATSIISMTMFFLILKIILSNKLYKKTELLKEFDGPSLKVTKEILKLGIPIGIGIFAEMSMFSGAAIIIGQLGDKVLSGHAIALNIASVVFMLPLAIGLAGSTRIGNLIGENRFTDAKFSSYTGVTLCFIGALINMTMLLLFRDKFASVYSGDLEVLGVAVSLLFYAAIFQIPDGIGMGSLGALRGYKDTFAPMVFLIISYWIIFAIPFGYFLTNYGITNPLGAEGMWISMILGLLIFSMFIFNRLRTVSSKYI